MAVLNLQLAQFLSKHQQNYYLISEDLLDVEGLQETASTSVVQIQHFFTSPWATNIKYEEEYVGYLSQIQELKIDKISHLLLCIMAITRPGIGVSYQDSKAVHSVHGCFVTLLKRYLNTTMGQDLATKTFNEYSDMLNTTLQRMVYIFTQERIIIQSSFEKDLHGTLQAINSILA